MHPATPHAGRTPLRRSEFLLPLDAATINLYHTLLRGAQ